MKSRSIKPASLCIPRSNRRGKNHALKHGKWLTCALCVVLALPGVAAAKKASTVTDVSCAVLLPAEIYTGTSFSVKVVRVPSYPGSWAQPTISIDVVYPMTSGSASTQNDTQTINKFNVTYALANFTVPSSTTGISSTPADPNAAATVTATVAEPLSNNRLRQTTCSATTPVVLAN